MALNIVSMDHLPQGLHHFRRATLSVIVDSPLHTPFLCVPLCAVLYRPTPLVLLFEVWLYMSINTGSHTFTLCTLAREVTNSHIYPGYIRGQYTTDSLHHSQHSSWFHNYTKSILLQLLLWCFFNNYQQKR